MWLSNYAGSAPFSCQVDAAAVQSSVRAAAAALQGKLDAKLKAEAEAWRVAVHEELFSSPPHTRVFVLRHARPPASVRHGAPHPLRHRGVPLLFQAFSSLLSSRGFLFSALSSSRA